MASACNTQGKPEEKLPLFESLGSPEKQSSVRVLVFRLGTEEWERVGEGRGGEEKPMASG